MMKNEHTTVKKAAAYILITILAFACPVIAFQADVYGVDTEVRIGEAACGENGLTGNSPGNQTGNELQTGGFYGGWTYVFRAKDPSIAKKMAASMKAACENQHVGYDLKDPDRETLYDVAKANDWDIASITTDCETTCVDLVSVCLNSAGVEMPSAWASVAVYGDLMPTGQFDCYTSSDYTNSPAKLLPGDILCNPGGPHTAMVIESPNKFLFEVKYIDEQGGDQTAKAEEGSEVKLYLNNGKDSTPVTIIDQTDLGKYAPSKSGYEFKGWEKKEDENTFTARYSSSQRALRTGSKKKDLE